MKRVIAISTISVLGLLLLASCARQAEEAPQVIERSGAVNQDGKLLTLLGPEIKVGQKAPDFDLAASPEHSEAFSDAEHVNLAQSKGNIRFISVVPSLDTQVSDLQIQRFEEEAENFGVVTFYTISMDSPSVQARYLTAKGAGHAHTHMSLLSDYRDGSFGRAYGVLIKESDTLSRAIFIIDKNDTIRYVQYVKDVSQHPDYDAALVALETVISESSVTPALGITTKREPETAAQGTEVGNQVGNLAPDFRLDYLDGKSISLNELRGKPVMINFWVTWCPHCQSERPLIQKTYDEWQSKGLVVLTIDILGTRPTETAANLAEYMQKNSYSFPVLLDTNREVTRSYGVKFTPTNFLIDRNGIIREIRTGPFPSTEELEASLNLLLAR